MLKTLGIVGFLIVTAAAVASMMVPVSHAPKTPSTQPVQEAGSTCGTHHCAPGAICCLSCTGELRCYGGGRCPECAQP